MAEVVMRMPDKEPAEVLDYDFVLTDMLVAGDVASTMSVALSGPDAALVLESISVDLPSASVKCWVSGGTAGTAYKLTCTMQTRGGRTHVAKMLIAVMTA